MSFFYLYVLTKAWYNWHIMNTYDDGTNLMVHFTWEQFNAFDLEEALLSIYNMKQGEIMKASGLRLASYPIDRELDFWAKDHDPWYACFNFQASQFFTMKGLKDK